MKRIFRTPAFTSALLLALCAALCCPATISAQGIHFSQYFNAPLLTNPANTGLMPDQDYRVGANYRSQWGAVPVPYHTFSMYGDLQVFRGRNENNWLGVGAALFTDKAGDGDLALNRYEAFAAYHVRLGERHLVSAGASAAYMQRSVDFSKFTWDAQWDGFAFDTRIANREKNAIAKTTYTDISAGVNYSYSPNDFIYIKASAGAAHINQPKESFLGTENAIGIRPTGNIDIVARVADRLIINPSVLYTTQKSASELLYGSLFTIRVSDGTLPNNVLVGAYQRLNDAIVGVIGYEYSSLRITASYDYTTSNLGQYINHNGAAELGLVWQSKYHNDDAARRRAFMCPRF